MEPDAQKVDELRKQRTLVLIKPDGVVRKLAGEIITRFERKGLKIASVKMVWPDEKLAAEHYIDSEEWLIGTGTNTYNSYREQGIDPGMTPREIGLMIREKLMEGITAGPVIALVLEGAHVVETVRRMRGTTSPIKADVGTIGFDYSVESYDLSDAGGWATRNIVHCSDSSKNAEREINIWFDKKELFDYETAVDRIFYSKDWHQHDKHPKNKA